MGFFYLSQVLRRPVWTQRGERVARIKDIVARLEALNAKGEVALEVYPPIAGLVVDRAAALLRRLTFGRLFPGADPRSAPPPEDASPRLKRRRLGPAKLIKWADVEPLKAGVPDVRLRLPHQRLSLLHPVDIAHIADELSYIQGAEIIESLDDERAADTLQEMDEERQADIVESMDAERAADILEEMAPDDAADLLADLDETQAEDLLRRMDPDDAEDVEELLNYPEESAGGII